jgi:hypothetical protein
MRQKRDENRLLVLYFRIISCSTAQRFRMMGESNRRSYIRLIYLKQPEYRQNDSLG